MAGDTVVQGLVQGLSLIHCCALFDCFVAMDFFKSSCQAWSVCWLGMLVCLTVGPCVEVATFRRGSNLDFRRTSGQVSPLSPVTSSDHVTPDSTSAWQFPRPPTFRRWKGEADYSLKIITYFFLVFQRQIVRIIVFCFCCLFVFVYLILS